RGSEIPLALFLFHGRIGVVVDDARGALGRSRHQHLFDDLLDARGGGADRAGTRHAAEAAEPAQDAFDRLGRARAEPLAAAADAVEEDDLAVANDRLALAREIERVDRNLLDVDVLPDVELGPVREREHPDRLARVDARVVEVPELGPLVLRIPLAELIAKREEPLLG